MTCQVPVPNQCTKATPTATPTATPIATSMPRLSRCPKVTPRQITAATGPKTGVGCASTRFATIQARPAVTAHWAIRNQRFRHRSQRSRADRRPSRAVRSLRSKARSLTRLIENLSRASMPSWCQAARPAPGGGPAVASTENGPCGRRLAQCRRSSSRRRSSSPAT